MLVAIDVQDIVAVTTVLKLLVTSPAGHALVELGDIGVHRDRVQFTVSRDVLTVVQSLTGRQPYRYSILRSQCLTVQSLCLGYQPSPPSLLQPEAC